MNTLKFNSIFMLARIRRTGGYFSLLFILRASVDKAKRRFTQWLRKMPEKKCALRAFTDEEVQGVINNAKSSKSIGTDRINMLMEKYLCSTIENTSPMFSVTLEASLLLIFANHLRLAGLQNGFCKVHRNTATLTLSHKRQD